MGKLTAAARVSGPEITERQPGFWARMTDALAELIFLERCRICHLHCQFVNARYPGARSALKSVCVECWHKVTRGGACADRCCLDENTSFPIASGCRYRGAIKELVYKLKYDGDRLIAHDLSLLLLAAWPRLKEETEGSELIFAPVPLHRKRLARRGYNQAELLARHAARKIGVPVEPRALKRVKETDPQHGLGRFERLANLGGAFAAERRRVEGRVVVLVDDICTSGATLSEAARAAMAAGAAGVVGLTVSRAVLSTRDHLGDI